MLEINATFGQEGQNLGLVGRTGEDSARVIVCDCAQVLEEYPGAEIVCAMRRACDAEAYAHTLTADGSARRAVLTAADVAAPGSLMIEFRAVRDGQVLKSAVYVGRVERGLAGQTAAPGNPVADVIDRLNAQAEAARKAADAAQQMADEVRRKLEAGELNGSDAEVTAENIQSALGYAPIKDVRLNGESLVQDSAATIPLAGYNRLGAVQLDPAGFAAASVEGKLALVPPTDAQISTHTHTQRPITPSCMDYAVTAAMTDGKGPAWTAAQQAAARERMGIDKPYELIEEITLTEGVKQIDRLNFGYAVSSLVGCVELPVVTAPFGMFMTALWDGDSYVTGYSFGLKEAESSIRFELAIHNGIITGQCQGSGKGWGSGEIYGVNNAASLKYSDKITGVRFYTPEANAVIPANTKITIYGVRA